MELDATHIIGLATITQSGQYLGRVKAVDCEPDTNRVVYVYVTPTIIKRLLCKQFVIHRDQVVGVTAEKLIVDDATIKELVSARHKAKLAVSPTK